MQRKLEQMASRVHDLVVIGGGITGACIARDAAMRGLSVALLEKGDFCHATSAASSKLIHGGLRYLKQLELSLVRESLRERRIWELIAPHQVHPLPWILPMYERRGASKLALRAGLTLYDLLGYDRNRLEDEDKKLPGHRMLSAEEVRALEPSLPAEGLVGAMRYFDCQMYSPERLCLEHLIDADAHGAQLANYAEVTGFLTEDTPAQGEGSAAVSGVQVRDLVGGRTVQVRGRVTVNASGPWADRLLARLPSTGSETRLVRSKGIHIITRALTREHAVVIESTGSHFFLIPWRGHTLIGTTDTIYRDDPDAFSVTEGDITRFLATINEGYASAELRREDVQWFYGGLRPLVESGGESEDHDEGTYDTSRRAEIVDHAKADGTANLVSALGGKWTTSRHLAEQVLRMVGDKLDRDLPDCSTDTVPLPGGHTGRLARFLERAQDEHASLEPEVVHNLVRNYGSTYGDVLALGREEPSLLQPVGEGLADLRAQVAHAVRHEMAIHLDDVLFRRTGIGTLGDPGPTVLQDIADLMAAEAGWDADRVDQELARARAHFTPRPDPPGEDATTPERSAS